MPEEVEALLARTGTTLEEVKGTVRSLTYRARSGKATAKPISGWRRSRRSRSAAAPTAAAERSSRSPACPAERRGPDPGADGSGAGPVEPGRELADARQDGDRAVRREMLQALAAGEHADARGSRR